MTHALFIYIQYLVEAMEILEMFCDLILARFGMVQQLKDLDEGISEAVCSIIWVAPRLQADIAEMKVISDMLTSKYGKPFADACRASVHPANVSEKLQHKMSIQAPPKLLVEKYLIEIAKIFNIDYEPDQQIMREDQRGPDGYLIDLNEKNNLDGNVPAPPNFGFVDFPQPPAMPTTNYQVFPILPEPPRSNVPFNYPPGPGSGSGGMNMGASFTNPNAHLYPNPNIPTTSTPTAPFNYSNYNIPPSSSNGSLSEKKDLNVDFMNVSIRNTHFIVL